jgi:hypothetical protein
MNSKIKTVVIISTLLKVSLAQCKQNKHLIINIFISGGINWDKYLDLIKFLALTADW